MRRSRTGSCSMALASVALARRASTVFSVLVASPLAGAFAHERHDVRVVDGPDVGALLDGLGLRITTMGRGPEEDPLFFRATAAAGALAAALLQ